MRAHFSLVTFTTNGGGDIIRINLSGRYSNNNKRVMKEVVPIRHVSVCSSK